MTPQLETPHVRVRGSIKTGPVHQVLLESGVAQRAMAKVLRGLPDPVKVQAIDTPRLLLCACCEVGVCGWRWKRKGNEC